MLKLPLPRPFTSNQNAGKYVGIDQSIAYGDSRIPIVNTTSGIVDTGTSLILLTSGVIVLSRWSS